MEIAALDIVTRTWAFRSDDAGAGELAQRIDELEPHERLRFEALRREGDRTAYLAAHLLLREAVAELIGTEAAAVRVRQQCPGCGASGHGRPFVAGLEGVALSLSHSVRSDPTRGGDSIAVAAVAARTTAPVGIDVEHRGARVPARAFTAAEREAVAAGRAPVELWVRKEAAVKAGATTVDGLGAFDVLADVDTGSGVLVFGEVPVAAGGAEPVVAALARWGPRQSGRGPSPVPPATR